MKKIAMLLAAISALVSFSAAAQPKFGHINSQELVMLMSEMDSARIKLQTYQTDLEETFQGMQTEYNTKLNTYQQKYQTWTPAVREAKEQELQGIADRIQNFQASAQQELQQMQQLYMGPVYEQANNAIQKVGKEQGLVYVIDLSAGALLYVDEAASMNILDLCKKELNIPAEKVAPTQINPEQ